MQFLPKNKKGGMWTFAADLAVIVLGVIVIIGVINMIFEKADDTGKEVICAGSVAFSNSVKQDLIKIKEVRPPIFCEPIEKEIPSKGYSQDLEGIKKEIGDLIARCWWMYGEGKIKNVFEEKAWWNDDRCMTCYYFTIKRVKDFEVFDSDNLMLSLATQPYVVRGYEDKCALGGGKCVPQSDETLKIECGEENEYEVQSLPKEYITDVCEKQFGDEDPARTKCCFNPESQCLNHGGTCESQCNTNEGKVYYPGWKCKDSDKQCCVHEDQMTTILDYVQGANWMGAIGFPLDFEFKEQRQQYAITFIGDTSNNLFVDHFNWGGLKSSTIKDINRIVVSEVTDLNSQNIKCERK